MQAPALRWRVPSGQAIAGFGVAGAAGVLVLYPIFYLMQAALDVGDPDARPPTAYGLGNFEALPQYSEIMLNTLTVSLAATVMALLFGFVTAWILSRTNVPGRRTLEQLMAVPYYMTPLLGAFAWSLLGAPESGFVNQVWRALGGTDALINLVTPFGIAWVMALFEGSVAFVMIGAVMKSMDPALEEASQVIGASRLRTMLRVTLPLVGPRARQSRPLLRRHHGDVPAGLAIPAAHPARRGDGGVAVRGHVPDAVPLSPADRRAELRHDQRQGVPAAGDGRRAPALAALRRVRPLRSPLGRAALDDIGLRLGAEDRRCLSGGVELDACQLSDRLHDECRAGGAREQPAAWGRHSEHRRRADGLDLVAHLPLEAARQRVHRIPGDVPPGGAAPGLRLRHDVGLDRLPDPDLRHALAPAHRLSDRVPAARRPHHLGRDAADRQEPRGMRADVRRAVGLSHPHRDDAAAPAWTSRRLAPALHRQRARARRLDPADGAERQGGHADDRRIVVRDERRAHRRDGADPNPGDRGRDGGVPRPDAARVDVRGRVDRMEPLSPDDGKHAAAASEAATPSD